MKSLPFPLRVAAGLAVTTAERVRELPKHVAGFPVTVASQVLQASMRVQQHITELAIKGDDALSVLRPVEETPSWATFDEELDDLTPPPAAPDVQNVTPLGRPPVGVSPVDGTTENNGHRPTGAAELDAERLGSEQDEDPWAREERALAQEHTDGDFDSAPAEPQEAEPQQPEPQAASSGGPAGLNNYDELTLPQVRARLRHLSLAQLEELLAYERAHADRPSFVGMLARRIGNVRGKDSSGEGGTGAEGSTQR
ncbi:lipid droplet-associated protein [Amycolatopsis palatopharyngis]|uniref:lipid droplet-associated protein n=1 Tax=Amycolatopsis palatopharyngis TaxID=187982 RepID=UPI000E26852C|nr:lipid droplet-associated protein [Amycolatopsis palatopharyngis]